MSNFNKKTLFTGLDILEEDISLQDKIKGKIAILTSACVTNKSYEPSVSIIKRIFKDRLTAIFGPQHGFNSDVQDNMIETKSTYHNYFKVPVYSLYSQTRIPTDDMLSGIDTILVDLLDVGTRVYTYASTLVLLLRKIASTRIKVVVLDRPNPIGGEVIEGNILDLEYSSFVGVLPIPQRHAMTLGEIGYFVKYTESLDIDYDVIKCIGWNRVDMLMDTDLPWIMPSPNLSNFEGALVYPGSVLFEGTNISEGRGTTRALEIIGFPKLNAYEFVDYFNKLNNTKYGMEGFILRAVYFVPTFQKYANITCGGIQIHPTDYKTFRPWKLLQILCKEFYQLYEGSFWSTRHYEYIDNILPIDAINGTNAIRKWVESNGSIEQLNKIETFEMDKYKAVVREIKIY